MRKNFILLSIIFITLNSWSQNTFQPGYIITTSGQKLDCLIKDKNWKINPRDIDYKLTLESETLNATIKDIKEFSVPTKFHFVRAQVQVDKTTDDIPKLGYKRGPEYVSDTLFLKYIVEGEQSLLYYEDVYFYTYFMENSSGEFHQLVHKLYLIKQQYGDRIGENNLYQQQLIAELKCESLSRSKLEHINYSKKALIKVFEDYHLCKGVTWHTYIKDRNKSLFELSIRPGINRSSLQAKSSFSNIFDLKFDTQSSFRIGVELAFVLPFNNNKWNIITEPTYQYFQGNQSIYHDDIWKGEAKVELNYQSIELPFGIRHHFFLNKKSSIFIDGLGVLDFPINSSLKYQRIDNSLIHDLEVKSILYIAFGLGFKYQKFSFQYRYYPKRDILDYHYAWTGDFQNSSFILGYTF